MARAWFYFRFHHEAMRDEKIRSLAPAQRWLWVAVLTAASKSPVRGYLLISGPRSITDKELADLANLPVREVKRTLPVLAQEGMIRWDDGLSCWAVTNWDKRQFESDNSTERVRKHRNVKRSTPVTGNVTGPLDETPLELRVKSKEGLPSHPPLTVVRDPTHDDDDEPSGQDTTNAALLILAERSLKAREAEKGPVSNREAWLAVAVQRRADLHAATIADALGKFTWRPEQLADLLEPPPKPEPAHPQAPRTVRCLTCSDRPYVYDIDEYGNAVVCPDCLPAEEPA